MPIWHVTQRTFQHHFALAQAQHHNADSVKSQDYVMSSQPPYFLLIGGYATFLMEDTATQYIEGWPKRARRSGLAFPTPAVPAEDR